MKYRMGGKAKRLSFGVHPEVRPKPGQESVAVDVTKTTLERRCLFNHNPDGILDYAGLYCTLPH